MKRDAINLGSDRIPSLFAKIFLPTLVGMVCASIMTTIDGVFVGHGVGSDALAAVNIFAPFWLLMNGIGLLFGIGCSVVASIHISQGNVKAACINVTQTIIYGVLFTSLICLVISVFSVQTARLLGASDRLLPYVLDYQGWLAYALPAIFLESVGLLVIRLDGSPKYAMYTSAFPAVVNVVLDYVFLFVLHRGLEGVAIATLIGCWTGGAMVLVYMFFFPKTIKFYRLKMSFKSFRLSLRNLGYQFRLGVSAFLGEASIAVLMFVGNYVFMDYLGEDGVAAFSIACYVLPFIFMTGNAISQSAQPIISYNHGAGDNARVQDARRISIVTALFLGLLLSLAMFFGAKYVAALFLDTSANAYRLAADGIPLMSLGFTFFVLNIAVIGYFQSIEKARPATIYALARGFVFLVPCFFLVPKLLGVPGIWLAFAVSEMLTSLLILLTRTALRVRARRITAA